MKSPWGIIHEDAIRRKWELGQDIMSTIWGANWDYYGTADRCRHTLYSCPCWLQEVSIVTKEVPKSVPVTINKAPPLPPLLAKSKKEINVISKYFQPSKTTVKNNAQRSNVNSGISYAQASKSSINMNEVLKIKETFPSLNAQKIKQVNNIINGQNKPKPHIRMTTKGPSRKQIIIPMSDDNISSFMKNSTLHVANINRLLRNAKTEVLVDYIHSDNSGIIIITNKVA